MIRTLWRRFSIGRYFSIALLALVCAAAARGDEKATVSGVVTYLPNAEKPWRYERFYVRDARTRALSEAVVALRPSRRADRVVENRAPRVAELDQLDFNFTPETLVIHAGDTVRFLNSDPRVHNVSTSGDYYTFSLTLGQGESATRVFDRGLGIERPVFIGCKLHSGMRAWIFVMEHPYFQVTGIDGKFSIEAPPGEYRLQVRHAAGELSWSREVTLTPGGEFRVDPVLGGR